MLTRRRLFGLVAIGATGLTLKLSQRRETSEMEKLLRFAQEEFGDAFPPISLVFDPEPEIVQFYDDEGRLLCEEYSPNHSSATEIVERGRHLLGKGYDVAEVRIYALGGRYEPGLRRLTISERDGCEARPFGHELLHPVLHPWTDREIGSRRGLAEAYADTLGAIALVDLFYGEERLTAGHLDAYRQAQSREERLLVLPHGPLRPAACTSREASRAVEIASLPCSLRERALRARNLLNPSSGDSRADGYRADR